MKVILGFQKKFPDTIEWYWKFAAKGINWWTKSNYFHVELSFDDKWVGAYTDGGIKVRECNATEHFNGTNKFSNGDYDYYELLIEDLTDSQKKILWKWIYGEVGTGYDWKGIYLSQIVNLDSESKNKWFCSEMSTKILQLMYVEEFIDCKPSNLAPVDVFNTIKHKLTKLN
jgi:hypothetical protein